VGSVFDTHNAHECGFDPSGPFSSEQEDYQMVVPGISAQISSQQITVLESRCINTLQGENRSGENTYLHCLK